jgi:hypothetical protein
MMKGDGALHSSSSSFLQPDLTSCVDTDNNTELWSRNSQKDNVETLALARVKFPPMKLDANFVHVVRNVPAGWTQYFLSLSKEVCPMLCDVNLFVCDHLRYKYQVPTKIYLDIYAITTVTKNNLQAKITF